MGHHQGTLEEQIIVPMLNSLPFVSHGKKHARTFRLTHTSIFLSPVVGDKVVVVRVRFDVCELTFAVNMDPECGLFQSLC